MIWQQKDTPAFVTKGFGTYYALCKFLRFADETITIGKYCSIAQEVQFIAGGQHRTDTISTYPFDVVNDLPFVRDKNSRHYKAGPGIVIGNDVWIGWGAKIVGNLVIEDGAVIGAGAVVMTDIPAYGIALGNPARVTKYRFSDLNVRRLLNVAWWDWPEEKVKERREWFYRPVEEFLEEFER